MFSVYIIIYAGKDNTELNCKLHPLKVYQLSLNLFVYKTNKKHADHVAGMTDVKRCERWNVKYANDYDNSKFEYSRIT